MKRVILALVLVSSLMSSRILLAQSSSTSASNPATLRQEAKPIQRGLSPNDLIGREGDLYVYTDIPIYNNGSRRYAAIFKKVGVDPTDNSLITSIVADISDFRGSKLDVLLNAYTIKSIVTTSGLTFIKSDRLDALISADELRARIAEKKEKEAQIAARLAEEENLARVERLRIYELDLLERRRLAAIEREKQTEENKRVFLDMRAKIALESRGQETEGE